MTKEIVVLEAVTEENAPAVFVQGGLDRFVEAAREAVAGEVPDMTTAKGRERIASLAYSISRSKSAIEKPGRDYLRQLKAMPKVVETELREFVQAMDALRDEVRQPLNEWEQYESERKIAHERAIDKINLRINEHHQLDAGETRVNIQWLENDVVINDSWEEYELEAGRAKDRALMVLREHLVFVEAREAEQAELERLRQEAAERERVEREERIAREAAEKAKAAAEAEVLAAKQKAELEEQKRIAAEKQAELDKIEAAKKAEQERIDAEKRAAERVEAAAQAERDRIAQQQAAVEREKQARERDQEHRRKINRDALAAIVQTSGITAEQAEKIVRAIVSGSVPNVSINY